jgi:hypothetical protein
MYFANLLFLNTWPYFPALTASHVGLLRNQTYGRIRSPYRHVRTLPMAVPVQSTDGTFLLARRWYGSPLWPGPRASPTDGTGPYPRWTYVYVQARKERATDAVPLPCGVSPQISPPPLLRLLPSPPQILCDVMPPPPRHKCLRNRPMHCTIHHYAETAEMT